jgi:hypothetical protein
MPEVNVCNALHVFAVEVETPPEVEVTYPAGFEAR